MTPLELAARFAELRVLVIGESMLDSYLTAQVGRLCREAPVPILSGASSREVPGGAANTAVNVSALGARTTFLSAVGQDDCGARLRCLLAATGMDLSAMLAVPGRETIVKQRISGNGQLLLRLDHGTEADLDELHERRLLDALAEQWSDADAVIISDYGYGAITPAMVDAIAARQRRDPRILVVDAKDLARWSNAGVTAAKPNYAEAVALVGLTPMDAAVVRVEQVISARTSLAKAIGAEVIAVTLDTAGAVVFEGDRPPYRTYTQPAPDHHSAGAGDSFTAAFALALAAGGTAAAAADLAAAAATASVAVSGTTVCDAAMLEAQLCGEHKLATADETIAAARGWKAAGKRVVFTNGCFDILHHGHIAYLNRAKALGDILIVGLNSDASVRALKGPTRPINPQEDRAAVLAALGCVDRVAIFDEATPAPLIAAIRPDLFVKGGDYTLDTLPEAELVKSLGGEIKLMPFLDDRSTTGIIERIRTAELREAG